MYHGVFIFSKIGPHCIVPSEFRGVSIEEAMIPLADQG